LCLAQLHAGVPTTFTNGRYGSRQKPVSFRPRHPAEYRRLSPFSSPVVASRHGHSQNSEKYFKQPHPTDYNQLNLISPPARKIPTVQSLDSPCFTSDRERLSPAKPDSYLPGQGVSTYGETGLPGFPADIGGITALALVAGVDGRHFQTGLKSTTAPQPMREASAKIQRKRKT